MLRTALAVLLVPWLARAAYTGDVWDPPPTAPPLSRTDVMREARRYMNGLVSHRFGFIVGSMHAGMW